MFHFFHFEFKKMENIQNMKDGLKEKKKLVRTEQILINPLAAFNLQE